LGLNYVWGYARAHPHDRKAAGSLRTQTTSVTYGRGLCRGRVAINPRKCCLGSQR